MVRVICIVLAFACAAAWGQETAAQRQKRLEWWREARFGMFIHWGPISIKGTEIGWSRGREVPVAEYDNLYKQFNPTKFDAKEWVSIAKAAGMKYLVITSKHHAGFCLWDSKLTDYDIMSTPFGRDVLRELSDECRKQGVRFCIYHSILDWHHPDYPIGEAPGGGKKVEPQMPRYVEYLKGQLKEIETGYGPLGIFWFDGEWEAPWTHDMGLDLYRYCRSLQPAAIINNRVDKGRRGMEGSTEEGEYSGDYDTPEQTIGQFQMDRPWETCMTICQQWAWKPDDRMKSFQECIHTLVRCVGGDGNLLFNVGPMPTGEIEPRQVGRLKEMGAWMQKYGQTIYGTRGGPWKPGKWGATTRKENRIYVHVLSWPKNGLVLPELSRRKISDARVMNGGQVMMMRSADGIWFDVAEKDRDSVDTIIELEVDGPAIDEPVIHGPVSLALRKTARASNVFQKQSGHAAGRAFDGNEATRWATDGGTKSAWLEVDLGSEQQVGRVAIDEAFAGRVRAFELQYRDGDEWKTFFTGKTIGADWKQQVSPVRARYFRLNILEAMEGPTINEFELYPK